MDNDGQGFTYTGSATNWARSTIDQPDGMNSVSCPRTSLLRRGGQHGNEYTYNGSNWTAAQSINSNNSLTPGLVL